MCVVRGDLKDSFNTVLIIYFATSVSTLFFIKSSSNLKPRDSFGENDVLSLTFNISAKSSSNSTIWGCFGVLMTIRFRKKTQIVELGEDMAEILKVKDNTSFSSLLLNEKKLNFEMISGVFNLQ